MAALPLWFLASLIGAVDPKPVEVVRFGFDDFNVLGNGQDRTNCFLVVRFLRLAVQFRSCRYKVASEKWANGITSTIVSASAPALSKPSSMKQLAL